MKLFAKAILATLLVLLPLMTACAPTERWFATIRAPKTSPTPAEVSQPTERVISQAEAYLAAGAYQKAIDTFQAGLRRPPRNRSLVRAYRDSLETMAAKAGQAYRQQDFGAAGRLYALLEKNYEGFGALDMELSFDRDSLTDRLERCKRALYSSGFQAYRDGNLDQAIALWQDLLAIDPQNTGIQDALRTAKRQQENLREAE